MQGDMMPYQFYTCAALTCCDAALLHVMQESFDPIIDMTTRKDLLPKMIYAESLGEFDFQGMYSILLKHK